MKTHPHQSHNVLMLLAGGVLVLALAVIWLPRADSLWSISSTEVDDLLYRSLDDYQRAIERSDELRMIMQKALTAPDTLSGDERAMYVSHERRFFNGWEMVFNYGDGGYLSEERFQVWDNWYRAEFERRPRFAWTENKALFVAAFVNHVEGVSVGLATNPNDCATASAGHQYAGTMARSDANGCPAEEIAGN